VSPPLNWQFSVTAPKGDHVRVCVRCGPKPQDRALLGVLSMRRDEWEAMRYALAQGLGGTEILEDES